MNSPESHKSGRRVSDEDPPRGASRKGHGLFWIGLVIGLLGAQILLLSTMVYIATSDPSFAVEPDYYQKGLNWDATARQLNENRKLGWNVRLSIPRESTFAGERAVTCRLSDPDGQPIEGAVVDLVAFPHARGTQRISVLLEEQEPGQYGAAVPLHRSGLWEFRFAIRRGEDSFTHVMRRNVAPTNQGQDN